MLLDKPRAQLEDLAPQQGFEELLTEWHILIADVLVNMRGGVWEATYGFLTLEEDDKEDDEGNCNGSRGSAAEEWQK